jgi:hypothetical protein
MFPKSLDRIPTRISDWPTDWISLAVLTTGTGCGKALAAGLEGSGVFAV